jgi:hypothetical protein
MTENLPEPYEGEYIEGEVVEGDIWESCNLHHMRHCLACFPHQPWHRQDDVLDAWLLDLEAVREQVFRDLFGHHENMTNIMEEIFERDRQRRIKMQKRCAWMWYLFIPLYSFVATMEFKDGRLGIGFMYAGCVVFSAFMLWWNRKRIKELESG